MMKRLITITAVTLVMASITTSAFAQAKKDTAEFVSSAQLHTQVAHQIALDVHEAQADILESVHQQILVTTQSVVTDRDPTFAIAANATLPAEKATFNNKVKIRE